MPLAARLGVAGLLFLYTAYLLWTNLEAQQALAAERAASANLQAELSRLRARARRGEAPARALKREARTRARALETFIDPRPPPAASQSDPQPRAAAAAEVRIVRAHLITPRARATRRSAPRPPHP